MSNIPAPPAREPAYAPLHDPASDADHWTPPVDMARRLARKALAKHEGANIHDDDAMLRAAVGLELVLRDLLDALDAGERK
ncbi:hypothetical protein ACFWDI_35810 [Streptomyces sp. NPDC060064]|uniref:hypothetical protein n=1 Tax=Streptomyces sp. NPDC060064 TaxID=3347049 RepID=UPI0036983A02